MPMHHRIPRHRMKARPTRPLLVLLACLLPAAAGAGAGQPSLPEHQLPAEIRDTLETWQVPDDAVSILVRGRDDDRPRLSINADIPRNPASVTKLLTTYAALEKLGPAYTWETRVRADGPVRDGVLAGDLWIEGSGDPYLTAEDFWKLLGGVRRRGIERIEGDLVLDTGRFGPPERDPGEFDDEPFRAYNQPPHALLVNLNAIKFELESANASEFVRISMHPPLGNLPVENRLRLEPGVWCGNHRWHVDYEVVGTPGSPEAVIEGRYGTECGIGRLRRTGLPVESYVHGLFGALWNHWGGSFDGAWRTGSWKDSGAEPLVRHESRSLAEVVRLTNKYSNNVMARQLALTVAAESGDTPASEADGRRSIRETLVDRGLDTEGMILDEVAGLSRDNRITANQVAQLLAIAADSLVMPEFVASLPVAGVDGTLRNRLRESPEAGRVRMKTGMIDDVSAIAGYMRNAADEDLIVVVLINHHGAHRGRGRAIQDAVLRWAYRETS